MISEVPGRKNRPSTSFACGRKARPLAVRRMTTLEAFRSRVWED
jgi:hypothetical protein